MKKEKTRAGKLRILVPTLTVLVVALLIIAMGLLVLPLTEGSDTAPVPGSADWMARLPDEVKLNRIVLPGTHDSATQYVQLTYFSRCQNLSVAGQLEAGFRYLDIRLGDAQKDETAPRLTHGFAKCKTGAFGGTLFLDRLLDDCYAFLAAHPTETVLFAVKHEHGDAPTEDFEKTLQRFTQAEPSRWLLSDTIPTLGEARGKLVLLRRYEDAAGLGAESGIPFLWEDQKGHDDVSLHTAAADEGDFRLWVQDRFEYGIGDKWAAFTAGLAAPAGEDDIVLSFLSTKGTAAYGHPYQYAEKLNAKLLGLERAELRGWIVTDFATPKLAEHIYGVNFA